MCVRPTRISVKAIPELTAGQAALGAPGDVLHIRFCYPGRKYETRPATRVYSVDPAQPRVPTTAQLPPPEGRGHLVTS